MDTPKCSIPYEHSHERVGGTLHISPYEVPLLGRLYPPPLYEMPDNFFFEMTGMLQFFVALLATYYSFRFVTKLRQSRRHS